MSPDEAVVIMKGPHTDMARAAEYLAGHGVAAEVLCPETGG